MLNFNGKVVLPRDVIITLGYPLEDILKHELLHSFQQKIDYSDPLVYNLCSDLEIDFRLKNRTFDIKACLESFERVKNHLSEG